MDLKYITGDEREALYNEVWTEPVTIVAKRYNMTDNGLRKHLIRLGIPLPPRGYWEKIKSGQSVTKSSLPKVTGELKKHVRSYVIKYRKDIEQLSDDELSNPEELGLLTEETKCFIKRVCESVEVKGQLRNPYPLITEHKEEMVYRKKRDKALKQASFNSSYYASVKSKYRDNKPIIPIQASESNINRAYRIINTIMATIEELEGNTRVHIESGKDMAYFFILRSVFHFEIKEEVKKQTCLILSMSAKNWITNIGQSTLIYKDNKDQPLESQVGSIIYDMFVIANKYLAADEMKERVDKRKWEEYDRQRRLEQMRKGELEEVKILEQSVSDWDKAEKIRRFTDNMETKLNDIKDGESKEKLIRWLKWARDKADWLDPLTEKEDELLGKSKHLFNQILKEE